MDDLVTWLQLQVAEDERQALAASPGRWHPNAERDEVLAGDDIVVCEGFALSNNQLRATVDHIVAWDPTRVLAECDAKRKIIFEHLDDGLGRDENGQLIRNAPPARCTTCLDTDRRAAPLGTEFAEMAPYPCRTLREYGAMYAKLGRPGYREGWRP